METLLTLACRWKHSGTEIFVHMSVGEMMFSYILALWKSEIEMLVLLSHIMSSLPMIEGAASAKLDPGDRADTA